MCVVVVVCYCYCCWLCVGYNRRTEENGGSRTGTRPDDDGSPTPQNFSAGILRPRNTPSVLGTLPIQVRVPTPSPEETEEGTAISFRSNSVPHNHQTKTLGPPVGEARSMCVEEKKLFVFVSHKTPTIFCFFVCVCLFDIAYILSICSIWPIYIYKYYNLYLYSIRLIYLLIDGV